jgi:predicted enzyme related to lactoylglutathione lyase
MHLAKPNVDIGLATNNLEKMLGFWQNEVGLPFDHMLPIARGQRQYRHDLLGSVLKVNSYYEPLPEAPTSGYRELLIARDKLVAPLSMCDPDGTRVTLVPPGTFDIQQIGIKLAVRDVAAHKKFYLEALGLNDVSNATQTAFQAGNSTLFLEQSSHVTVDAPMRARGWRYITFQVFKVDIEHARIMARGGREAMKPTTLGTTARISMICDPDGNWIEISQRASITGSVG